MARRPVRRTRTPYTGEPAPATPPLPTTPRRGRQPRQFPVPQPAPPPVPSSALEGLRGTQPTFRKNAALDVINQEINRGMSDMLRVPGELAQLLTRAFLGGVYEFPKLFGGEAFVPQAGRPPRGVTRERFLGATRQYGQTPSRLALGAPEVITQADLPTFVDTPHLASAVRYGKQLMIGLQRLSRKEDSLYDPSLYNPEDYYYGGGGGNGGGGVVVVRGGGSPGSQSRNYKSGLINWRI